MTFDSNNGVVVLFGGFRFSHGNHLDDTWVYDVETNTWEELHPVGSPPPRHWGGFAYDKDDGVIVLFGGHSPFEGSIGEIRNDTWILNLSTEAWTKVNLVQSPSPRQTFLIYNESDGLVYLFGGLEQVYRQTDRKSSFYNDMWSYDVSINTWTQISGFTVTLSNPNQAEPYFTAPKVMLEEQLVFQLIVDDGLG